MNNSEFGWTWANRAHLTSHLSRVMAIAGWGPAPDEATRKRWESLEVAPGVFGRWQILEPDGPSEPDRAPSVWSPVYEDIPATSLAATRCIWRPVNPAAGWNYDPRGWCDLPAGVDSVSVTDGIVRIRRGERLIEVGPPQSSLNRWCRVVRWDLRRNTVEASGWWDNPERAWRLITTTEDLAAIGLLVNEVLALLLPELRALRAESSEASPQTS